MKTFRRGRAAPPGHHWSQRYAEKPFEPVALVGLAVLTLGAFLLHRSLADAANHLEYDAIRASLGLPCGVIVLGLFACCASLLRILWSGFRFNGALVAGSSAWLAGHALFLASFLLVAMTERWGRNGTPPLPLVWGALTASIGFLTIRSVSFVLGPQRLRVQRALIVSLLLVWLLTFAWGEQTSRLWDHVETMLPPVSETAEPLPDLEWLVIGGRWVGHRGDAHLARLDQDAPCSELFSLAGMDLFEPNRIRLFLAVRQSAALPPWDWLCWLVGIETRRHEFGCLPIATHSTSSEVWLAAHVSHRGESLNVTFKGRDYSQSQFRDELASGRHACDGIQITAESHVSYRDLVTTLDRVRQAGVSKIGIWEE